MNVSEEICSICGTKLMGPYCHQCGQLATHRPTSRRDVSRALLSGIFSVERGIIGIMWALTLHPARVVRNYWDGNRFYYYSPGQMIFYTIFVLGLHIAFVSQRILGLNVSVTGLGAGASSIFSPQMFFILLNLPLYSIATRVAFIGQHRSFPDHFISATYIFTYSAIAWTLIGDVLLLAFGVSVGYTTLAFLLTLFIWGSRVFLEKRKAYIHLLFIVLQVVVFLIEVALLILLIYLINPSSLNFTT